MVTELQLTPRRTKELPHPRLKDPQVPHSKEPLASLLCISTQSLRIYQKLKKTTNLGWGEHPPFLLPLSIRNCKTDPDCSPATSAPPWSARSSYLQLPLFSKAPTHELLIECQCAGVTGLKASPRNWCLLGLASHLGTLSQNHLNHCEAHGVPANCQLLSQATQCLHLQLTASPLTNAHLLQCVMSPKTQTWA